MIIYRNLVEEKREYVSQLDSPDTRDGIHDMSSYTGDLNARQFEKKMQTYFYSITFKPNVIMYYLILIRVQHGDMYM